MNTNLKFIYLIMYDIPSDKPSEYRYFRKELKKVGAVMLQESVYFIHVNSKEKVLRIKNLLVLIAPENSNVRGLLITNALFDSFDVICGEMSVGEKLVNSKQKIIEL